jgi:hypothetical protein
MKQGVRGHSNTHTLLLCILAHAGGLHHNHKGSTGSQQQQQQKQKQKQVAPGPVAGPHTLQQQGSAVPVSGGGAVMGSASSRGLVGKSSMCGTWMCVCV